MEEQLKFIVDRCKNSISITINGHRDYYESVEQHLEGHFMNGEEDRQEVLEEEVYQEMIKRNTIVCIQAYPDTAIGSYSKYHYDLAICLNQMVAALKWNDRIGE